MSDPVNPKPPPMKMSQFDEANRAELYSIVKLVYQATLDRFEAAERKAAQLATMFFAILGAASLGLNEFIKSAKLATNFFDWLFVCAYMCFYVVTIAGLGTVLCAFAVRKFRTLPLNEKVIAVFKSKPHAVAVDKLVRSYLKANQHNRATMTSIYRYIRLSYVLLWVTSACAIVSAVAYTVANL